MRPAARNASGMRFFAFTALLTMGSSVLFTAPAVADDVWTNVHAGIDHLHRIDGSQVVHAVVVDMSRPEMWLRATRDPERGQTTTGFAQSVGAAVAINADWFLDGYQPRGLAIGAGEVWPGSVDLVDHCFFACTLERRCTFDTWGTVAWTDPEWRNAVGANGDPLVENGQAIVRAEAFYDSERNPRSAVGMSQDQRTLILAVVQGRRADSAGMTFNETAELMAGLGAWSALMLDGGGSSALVIAGNRVSDLPTGSGERVVGNHLAVMRTEAIDARCVGIENQRACVDATVLQTCEGGNYSEGDCGFFGATCEELDGHGVCVDPRCTRGASGHFCLDGTIVAGCTRGAYGEGDCGAFGTACEDTGEDAFCVDPRCSRGGMGKSCLTATVLASCDRGAYSEGDCAAYGASCEDTGEDAFCVDPRCVGSGSGSACVDADLHVTCERGVYAEERCSDRGLACSTDASTCVDPACLDGSERTWCEGTVAWRCRGGSIESDDCGVRTQACVAGACQDRDGGDDAGAGAAGETDAAPEAAGSALGLEGCGCRIAGAAGQSDSAAPDLVMLALALLLSRWRSTSLRGRSSFFS